MLITLLYHRSTPGKYGNSLEILESHFAYLKKHAKSVLPSDPLTYFGLPSVCLSFDDATYDFYHDIFPLLKKYDLKALLAVPAGFIEKHHEVSPEIRLKALKSFSFQNSPPSYAFCSWDELKEMIDSKLVKIASHGMSHTDLSKKDVDLQKELQDSKNILERALGISIDTFVFPYGRYSLAAYMKAKKNYKILMRIGNAANLSWKSLFHYRVSADNQNNISEVLFLKNKLFYLISFLLKQTIFHFKFFISKLFN